MYGKYCMINDRSFAWYDLIQTLRRFYPLSILQNGVRLALGRLVVFVPVSYITWNIHPYNRQNQTKNCQKMPT